MQIWSWTKNVQKSNQNQFGEGLGLYLGGVWGRLGPPLGAFGRLVAAFWTFKIELLSSICPKWAPGGLLDGFWLALRRFWEGLGRVCGEILGGFWTFWTHSGKILEMLGMISPCWGRFSKMDPRADPRSVTIFSIENFSAEKISAEFFLVRKICWPKMFRRATES